MSRTTLLNLLWRSGHLCDREFTGTAGETISVVSPGEFVDETGVWNTAKIVVDGEIRQGYVAVGEGTPVPDGAILRVVESYVPSVLGIDDRLVPQIECPIDAGVARCYDSLRTGAEAVGCAERIAEMESTHRTFLFSRLLVERLSRKYDDIMRLFGEKDEDWNQTFYTMLLRVMGGDRNREAYMSLASKVDFAMLSREKGDPQRIEALLLGGGGFLFSPGTVKDEYTLRLEDEFRHLAAKYSIVPLKPAVWDTSKVHVANLPTVRLAQIAALVSKKDFMLDRMLACRRIEDVDQLFGVQASEYWDTHCKPGVAYGLSPKRLGRSKTSLIGINLVVPLMFAYGKETGADVLCDRALDLLETIPAERNAKLAGWYARGCEAASGFESQALLQLAGEYCRQGACAACPVGREEIRKHL